MILKIFGPLQHKTIFLSHGHNCSYVLENKCTNSPHVMTTNITLGVIKNINIYQMNIFILKKCYVYRKICGLIIILYYLETP